MLHKVIQTLIADDSSIVRDIVKTGIQVHREKRYFEINAVADGLQALTVLKKKPVDLAFIDINMPGLSGPQVVSAMAETSSKGCLSIAMSSEMNGKAEHVLKEFGAYHFLKKPFRPDHVADIVSSYMIMKTGLPILIVDDSATMRKLARKILENSRFDFEIGEAECAEAALRAISSGKYRIVLTDFHMPGTDGLELAGAIREISSKISIYMMSTNDTSYLERSAAFIGINGFLKKPFTSKDIDAIMHTHMELENPKFGETRNMFRFLEWERERKAASA